MCAIIWLCSMFNVHLLIMDKMQFIYSLVDNGTVFYIGRTANVALRYKQHLNIKTKGHTNAYIAEMLKSNRLPEIIVIYYLPVHEAEIKEKELISLFSMAGHTIVNKQHHKFSKNAITDISNIKSAISSLKKAEKEFVQYCNWNQIFHMAGWPTQLNKKLV